MSLSTPVEYPKNLNLSDTRKVKTFINHHAMVESYNTGKNDASLDPSRRSTRHFITSLQTYRKTSWDRPQ
jgi:hypothetical protein